MKLITILACCIAACYGVPSVLEEWTAFKAKHGKSYKSIEEEHLRLGIYLSNKQMIEEHNQHYKSGLVSYELGMNHFGDRLQEELKHLNGLNKTGLLFKKKQGLKFSSLGETFPSSIDWREMGAVTPVKDQGTCESCWAFSATGSLEGQLFRKTGRLVSLSEQNLVDCSSEYGNRGCSGGLMDQAFQYVIQNNGIDSEESYPYEGEDNSCRFRQSETAATGDNYVDIEQNDEEALQNAVATIGPISIAINAGLQKFVFYSRGVFSDPSCDSEGLNHGVLLVGYGSENGHDYWLVKNSWNTVWGEDGYVKIARNNGNMCGVASYASYPVV